ncbi:uncharacterized protein LOC126839684 [Adelges cooleyi]|uniref:uncharacterized protein LOC126839684 n=1 Tax=Adelges cooleyi TaxID=133065 RepID=UPI00217FD3DD|nr:uncharacterized protein LOC126839684 [Adelges cooleyi]
MSYLGINASLRTNVSFRSKTDEDYHKGLSRLELFHDLNITDCVVLEYMHDVCLGVMKRLISFWKKGKKSVRLINDNVTNEISSELEHLKSYFPKEFNRLPRSLEELEYWKAVEFRSFLLYSGPIVLKGKLQKTFYKHFMLLHCAIRLLVSNETCITYNELANTLLRQFVIEYAERYGEEYITYNVHGLIHVSHFVKIHGSLDTFSAFKFENYLQNIKNTLKNARFPL